EHVFFGCTSLTSVTIPDSVKEIGEHVFFGCTSLTSVTIPVSVKRILYSAFENCTSLTSVTIPDSVTEIGINAFLNCTGLTSVTIPDSVTEIGAGAFSGCTSLASVTIPDSVTKIHMRAFSGCTSLASVTIPDSVTEIGWRAFWRCTSLASITIPDSVVEVGKDAFKYCASLMTMVVPDSMQQPIDAWVFEGRPALAKAADEGGVANKGLVLDRIRRRDIELADLYGIDETDPSFWTEIIDALGRSYFDRVELRGVVRADVVRDYGKWLRETDWLKLFRFCISRAGGSVDIVIRPAESLCEDELGSYRPGRMAALTWLPTDGRVVELLCDAGAKCGSAYSPDDSLTREDTQLLMMYGQADVVRDIFQREGKRASRIKITDWMLERMARSGNGSALRWVFDMHAEAAQRVTVSISSLFDARCFDSALALIEARDS
ncbi:leucine-rich repeat domain-containing protein, partial [Cloacibacillus sp. DZ-S5]|uniref:leucine-rich repeat domain-containing protein n=1 Tax=Cloacibacillus sp. DZ-S5 TaxID=3396783 RepID=UPI003BEF3ADE